MIDIELYGGKRGLLEHARARMLYALGVYGDVRRINWVAVTRLVFICKGNICRSPYASARARTLGLRAASFGLDATEGDLADPAASRNALLRGVDLSDHRATRVESCSFARDDLVIVFEPQHLVEVRRLSRGVAPASLMGIWAQPIYPHIQDPYGRGDRYFQRCFSLIDANLAALAGFVTRGDGPMVSGNACHSDFHNRTLA